MQRLSLHNLGCHLGGKWLFTNLQLTLQSGQLALIEGENGSGKTTLLALITGHLPPDSGYIHFQDDAGLHEDERLSMMAYFGHRHGLQEGLKVIESLSFWKNIYDLPDIKLQEALQFYDLNPLANHYIHQLSEGTKRRIGLARLMMISDYVSLFLLDEPSSHLDAVNKAKLYQMLEGFLHKGGMVVITAHEPLPIKATIKIDLSAHQPIRHSQQDQSGAC